MAAGCFEIFRLVIVDKTPQRWFIHCRKNVSQFFIVSKALREDETIGFTEPADQRLAALTADLTVLLTVSHKLSLVCTWPRPLLS